MESSKFVVLSKNQSESHSEYAYRVLRDNIMKFRLAPGTPINEAEIAAALNISRTPVHEAVTRLKDECLVDIVPRKESRVSKIDISQVNEGIFMRTCIEPEVFLMAKGNISGQYIKKFLDNLNEQKRILNEEKELYRYYPVDDEFHMLFYEAANKMRTYRVIKKTVTHFDRLRYLVRFDGDFGTIEKISYEEHKALFKVLAYDLPLDSDIYDFFKRHIVRFQTNFDVLMERYSDYISF